MSFNRATNEQSHSHRGFNTSNQRVVEWVAQQARISLPQTPTEMGSNRAPSTAVYSQAQHQATTRQTTPTDRGLADIRTTVGEDFPIQQSGIHGSINEQSARGTPRAPSMRTISLPPEVDELEEIALMSLIGNAARPIQGLNQHSIAESQSWEYPPAPMMRTIALPPVADAPPTPTGNSPSQTLQCQPDRERWQLNSALRYDDFTRPVVKPVLSDMLPYPGHRWGAWHEDESYERQLSVQFEYNMAPATDPPSNRMTLTRPFGGNLVVNPDRGNQFVSVGGVQSTVVAWMRWEQPHVQGEGLLLTGGTTATGRDGTTRMVEVWIWRGLTKANGESNVWEINL
ncbi:hypothetical protein AGABI1DRAFT_92462 [Agaricus bisporus var. burnettii JB137-S8]|uniref:Uncharacterized protein n=1 Tax=Agaricus bisporus var. burnettii (strain JB137-S8 / ATCC MYA-4627 / FGSC 10392) TaxID=597362 RepID=K5WU19_AGABU|nr:uncharacterized protein AGABI1DRAFT_92462 [Agaricus bisporus var. burnettii JB137-S8]EKM78936.1 hypothetical protein AGABI1DRAFT_92462 [Agaricus bisporus var. burnettii JB137-S8]